MSIKMDWPDYCFADILYWCDVALLLESRKLFFNTVFHVSTGLEKIILSDIIKEGRL
jgi:hypothetical protein